MPFLFSGQLWYSQGLFVVASNNGKVQILVMEVLEEIASDLPSALSLVNDSRLIKVVVDTSRTKNVYRAPVRRSAMKVILALVAHKKAATKLADEHGCRIAFHV